MTVCCLLKNIDKRSSLWKQNKTLIESADPKADINVLFKNGKDAKDTAWVKKYLKKTDFCSGLVHEYNVRCTC